MKTYKQKCRELQNKLNNLQKTLQNVLQENSEYKLIINDNKLFDPIEYQKVLKTLTVAIEGLEHIKFLEFTIEREDKQNASYCVAKEVLEQIREIFK